MARAEVKFLTSVTVELLIMNSKIIILTEILFSIFPAIE